MSLVSTNNIAASKYELEIAISAEEFEAAIAGVYKKRAKEFQVPGFRKGKAPRKTIEKLFGEQIFFEEAVNAAAPKALQEAYTESGLEIVVAPNVEVVSISKEDGVTLKAVCVVKPEVTVKEYKGLKASNTPAPVTDEDIQAEIDRMRSRNARTISVEDRAAQKDDIVVIDFEGFVDGVAFEGGKAEGYSLTLGSGQFIPGFEDQIAGHNKGETFDVNVAFPEEYHAEELKGKPATFKVTLHDISARELPEADDEFVKDVSEFDTLDELKADIAKKKAESNERAANAAFENALIDAIISNMEGDIPEEMVEARIDEMVQDFQHRLQSQGLSMDMYLQYTGMNADSFRLTFKEQADKQVKIALALEKIVEMEGIEPTEEEIDAEAAKLSEQYQGVPAEQIKAALGDQLKSDVAQKKAVELIKSSAVAE
ncbi:MAG: trigger factor [Oscillospiraceae bacterium]|jgi:trigger factor|nr:trigger factor [Oscillospiraceae bacterium]